VSCEITFTQDEVNQVLTTITWFEQVFISLIPPTRRLRILIVVCLYVCFSLCLPVCLSLCKMVRLKDVKMYFMKRLILWSLMIWIRRRIREIFSLLVYCSTWKNVTLLRYQTHLVVAVLQNRQWVILWTTAVYQDFPAVLLLYISLVMRQSSGWACSANYKKKTLLIR